MRRKDLMANLAGALVRRRALLRKTLAGYSNLIAANDRGVGDTIDAALECEQDELDSQLAAVESNELAAIDAALDRIRDGCYGICQNCEKRIPTARLQALPYAMLCINCQRKEERFGRSDVSPVHWERVTNESFDDEPSHLTGLELELV